jgi:F0F1-type ATP synthase membrane subunit b/b'
VVTFGARALAVTGQAADARALEQMLKEVGDKTADATSRAAELTGRAVKDAADTVTKVATDARRAITETDQHSRQGITAAVDTAKRDLTAEVRRLFGGEHPELLDRLQPVLDRFGAELDQRVRTGASELMEKAARQFDPTDPASPMARHAAALTTAQEKFSGQIERQHAELAAKVEELTTTLRVQAAKTTLAKVTPIKGGSFEQQVHDLMRGIAAGLGDEYEDTTTKAGLAGRSRKGDGVLNIDGGSTRVVLEMTDSPRTGWGDYLDEAERNRSAAAALGIVRTPEQNGNQTIRVLGPRRVVLSFDPDEDDPELLRTVILLLRTVAIAATVRTGQAEIATAEEKIADALAQLDKIDAVKKLATGIQKSATKIDSECTAISATIHRLLDQALVALGGTAGTAANLTVGKAESGAA